MFMLSTGKQRFFLHYFVIRLELLLPVLLNLLCEAGVTVRMIQVEKAKKARKTQKFFYYEQWEGEAAKKCQLPFSQSLVLEVVIPPLRLCVQIYMHFLFLKMCCECNFC